MYLVEAEGEAARGDVCAKTGAAPAAPLPGARWEDFPYSAISHHGEACCEVAREWVVAMDFAQLNGADLSAGPRWLRAKFKWGPSPWPMHWCKLVERDAIDCGAHQALAQTVFTARGLTAFPAQLVQQYSGEATDQWRGKWAAEEVSCHWLDGDVIYHEATAVLRGEDELRVWDGSAGCWFNPRQAGGYGSLLAVRIFAAGQWGGGDGLRWGERRLKPNQWMQIG